MSGIQRDTSGREVYVIDSSGALKNRAVLLDYFQTGDADWSAALTRALATGWPVEIPYNGGTVYNLSTSFSISSNTSIYGTGGQKPNLKLNGTVTRLFTLASVFNVSIDNLNIDGSKVGLPSDLVINLNACSDCSITRVKLSGSKKGFRLENGSTRCAIERCDFLTISAHGVEVNDATTCYNSIERNRFQSCVGFGIHVGDGAYGNSFSFNKTTSNGLELVCVDWGCFDNRVIGNHAEGSGDNGISIVGEKNIVQSNVCINNYNSGICVNGRDNSIVGNSCSNNCQSGNANLGGIYVACGYGGNAGNNVVIGNTFFDDQATPTQRYGIRVRNDYNVWTSGGTFYAHNKFCYYGLNTYAANSLTGTSGYTAGATPPMHTSGTVSDGNIAWTFIETYPTAVGPNGNETHNNITHGNVTAAYIDTSGRINNYSDAVSTTRNGSMLYFASGAPEGSVTASPGTLALVPNAAPYYKASGTGNTGWQQVGGSIPTYTVATRPAASAFANKAIWNSDTLTLQYSDGSSWHEVNGAPATDTIPWGYYFGSGSIPSGVALTRSSAGTYVNSAGTMASAATDVARFDYNPATLGFNGVIIEPSRTNLVLRTDASTAVAGAVGSGGSLPTGWSGSGTGLTYTIVGTGTEDGISYVDLRIQGTTGATFHTINFGNVSSLVTSTAYAGSFYARIVSGALTNITASSLIFRYNLSPSGSTDISATGILASINSVTGLRNGRVQVTGTTAGTLSGSGSFFLQGNHGSGNAVDYTIRIGFPQLEAGAAPSTFIATAGSAATRAADAMTVTVPIGIGTLTFTFDNNSSQSVTVSPGSYSVPTSLNRARIKQIVGS